MADESRRAGDWQRKDLRQNANDLMEDPNPKKWHQQTFWIVFFLLVFWPCFTYKYYVRIFLI